MNDDEIQNNRELLRKDKAFAWELAQIESMGPNWRDAQEAAAAGAEAGMGLPPGGGGLPGGGLAPDFGPTPPAPEGGAEGPEGGAEAGPAEVGETPTALP